MANPSDANSSAANPSDAIEATGPLAGLRVLDISTVVAGPFASTLLADLGAEVLKVEMPGSGDALRRLAPHKKNGVPLWWKVTNRNKKGITLDLRKKDGKALLGRLVERHDVLVENFRTGTLDEWGITRAWLQAINPRLTILRVTGFGQTGPYRNTPGFARVFEAMSGFTRMCGEEGGTPLHLGYPVSDAIGGLFGAIGILAELCRLKSDPALRGQEIDCSVTEAMMRTLDFLAIEYDQLGTVRTQSGNRSQYAAPGNIYATSDGKWASIAASTQSIFERFCAALELQHLLSDPRFADNLARVRNWQAIDKIVGDAIARLTLEPLRSRLHAHEVGFSPIYDAADIFADPHFVARQSIVKVQDDELGEVRMQCVVPRFSETPVSVRRAGPSIGQHNDEVYGGALGLAADEIARLRATGAI
jgi:crotonobetainyl-CoA:carnitine CoA-transferase CaiB-like acyl-CoA transferase